MAGVVLWMVLWWAVQGIALFAIVYVATRIAIRHERP